MPSPYCGTLPLHSYTKARAHAAFAPRLALRKPHRGAAAWFVDILGFMQAKIHDLKPGYYWYTMANDPLAVIHIHDDGGATLMGTDYRMEAQGVADMIKQGERFFWIEPPTL